jgi:hypothetical protein
VLIEVFTLPEQKLIVNMLKQSNLGAKKAEFEAKMKEYGVDLDDEVWMPNCITIFADHRKYMHSKTKELQARYEVACKKALTDAGIKVNTPKSKK